MPIPKRSDYLWATIVLGADGFIQFILPFILWFGAVKKSLPVSEVPHWRAVAYQSMVGFHSITYGVQGTLWPFTYWDKWDIQKWSWIISAHAWKYTVFLAVIGTFWVIIALILSGTEDVVSTIAVSV